MRATIVSAFVVLFAVAALASPQGLGAPSSVDASKWGPVQTKIETALSQLASQQNKHLTLVKLEKVEVQTVAGWITKFDGQFQADGQTVTCNGQYLEPINGSDKLTVHCPDQEYTVTVV